MKSSSEAKEFIAFALFLAFAFGVVCLAAAVDNAKAKTRKVQQISPTRIYDNKDEWIDEFVTPSGKLCFVYNRSLSLAEGSLRVTMSCVE